VIGGRLLTLDEVATSLGCSLTSVKRRVATGALPVFRDGRLVRVREADLERYLAEHLVRLQRIPTTTEAGRTAGPSERLWD
jgi:excisionase family DNA binding protein